MNVITLFSTQFWNKYTVCQLDQETRGKKSPDPNHF